MLRRQRPVEVERLAADRVPRVGARGRRGRRGAEASRAGLVGEQLVEGARERAGVARGHEAGGAVALGDLGEAADRAQHDRLAEGERDVEHARLLDLAVGQRDDVGAAE